MPVEPKGRVSGRRGSNRPCSADRRVEPLLHDCGNRTSDSPIGTFGAGTIIGFRRPSLWQPCSSSSGSPHPRETRPHRTSAARRNHRASPPTTALRRSNHRPPWAGIPPDCACLRSGLSPDAFGSLTAPHRRDDPTVAIGMRASRRWRTQGKTRCPQLRIPRIGSTGIHCFVGSSTTPGIGWRGVACEYTNHISNVVPSNLTSIFQASNSASSTKYCFIMSLWDSMRS